MAVLLVVCFSLKNQEGVWGKVLRGKGLTGEFNAGGNPAMD